MSLIENLKKLFNIFDIDIVSITPLIFLFLISGGIDLLGLSLIAPYISFLIEGNDSIFIEKVRSLDFLKDLDIKELIIFLSLIIFIIFFFKFIFALLIRFLIAKFSFNCRRKLQIKLLKSYQEMEYKFFNLKGSNEFIKNVRELSADCTITLDSGLKILSESIILVSIFIYLVIMNPLTFLTLLFVVGISFVIHNIFIKPRTIILGKKRVLALDLIYQAVNEGLRYLKEVRVLNKEKYFQNTMNKGTEDVYLSDLKTNIILAYPRYFFELLIVGLIIFFVILGLGEGQISKSLLPSLGIFAVAGVRIIPSVSTIAHGLIMINYKYFAIDVIFQDLIISKKNRNGSINLIEERYENVNEIEFRDISFKYENAKNTIFENLSLKIKKNECIGIIGGNGSGKTTLVDLLLGLLKPTSGSIYINNKLNNFNKFSHLLGYIPQEHLIVSDKIIKNITLENEEENVDKIKLKNSLQSSNLIDFVKSLEEGLSSEIGKNGLKLSGGQYKKIAIARLFYHNREVLILDEATNSLDEESETIVIEELKRLRKDKTILIISHNQKPLEICDKIYKIDNKRLRLI